MKALRRVLFIIKATHADRIFWGFIILLCVAGFTLRFIEPGIEDIGDGFWYLYVASTTIGFGDLYAVTPLGRIITVLVSMSGIVMVAMITGVVVSYYTEFVRGQKDESVSMFMEKLENLPDLSKEELEQVSNRIKEFRRKR
ncbi:MAG: two pore domain potassium channel family protein [Clostridiales bacterium]|nr:two pore domain potassium channel family protein [Clostridiales bacterium]MBR6701328.1 two pore domain potassium channel family protein [Bacillota bacterium]